MVRRAFSFLRSSWFCFQVSFGDVARTKTAAESDRTPVFSLQVLVAQLDRASVS